jgi:SSS family solute:Na+ symporter
VTLSLIDWLVVAAYFAANLAVGLYYRRRASKSVDEYFAGGRNVSWWLAGTSMVATTFAADTPLAVTGLVASHGIAGNWLWWNMLLGSMLTVFFFARLWRRAGVLTDVELAELRYSGPPAAFLRGFRALYLGLPINCIILGWVNLAMVKILTVIFPGLSFPAIGIHDPKLAALLVVFAIMVLTASISVLSGLWGVLVTDLIQFVLKMGMVIVLAYFAVRAAGGMDGLRDGLQKLDAERAGGSVLSFVPDVGSAWMPLLTFFVYIAVTWWATWYPGAEPGGGGYVAQRMFSAKDERHSLLATLWFAIAHYALRPWPWILAALASLVLYPKLADKESGYVQLIVDPNVFPPALRGLMVAAFAAAYMSTVATQLNWGASYLINDLYKRFWVKEAGERHYIRASKVATVILMVASCVVTYFQTSVSEAWKLLLAIGAGTGSVQILRWFWWRLNAWSEVSAMGASLVVSLFLQSVLNLNPSDPRQFGIQVLITVAVSTVVWLAVTFLTKPEPDEVLLTFYRRVRPNATFWGRIARKATDVPPVHDGRTNFLDWVAGVVMVYLALFGVGKIIFGEYGMGVLFLLGSAAASVFLYLHLSRRGWRVISDS